MSDAPGGTADDVVEEAGEAGEAGEAAVAQPDPVREAAIAELRGDLGDAVLDTVVDRGDMWVRVERSAWRQAGEVAKSHGFEYFCFLSGIDWLNNPDFATRYEQIYGGDEPRDDAGEGADAATAAGRYLAERVAGGTTRFQVFARLYDIDRRIGLTLKADLDDEAPSVESWTPVFRGADWHEREAWEMFGFDFPGHPSLRHLYLPSEFEGFPLRKDFPLLARVVKPWPGLVDKEPVPGEGDEDEEG